MADTSLLLVAYDITCPKRLRQMAHLLEDHGQRLQRSVFLCALTPNQIETLLKDARALIDVKTDHLFMLRLCARCEDRIKQFGADKPLPGSDGPIVV